MLDINTQIKEFRGASADRIPDSVLTATEPLVMRGLVSDWPMVTAANQSTVAATAYLQSFDSDKPLSAMTGDAEINGRIFYNSDLSGFNFQHQRMQPARDAQGKGRARRADIPFERRKFTAKGCVGGPVPCQHAHQLPHEGRPKCDAMPGLLFKGGLQCHLNRSNSFCMALRSSVWGAGSALGGVGAGCAGFGAAA